MRKRIIVVIFVILFLGVGVFVYTGQQKGADHTLYYSGIIEATESQLAFQVGGMVTGIHTDEGERVTQGMLLAGLDRSSYRARLNEAMAMGRQAMETVRRQETLMRVYEKTLPAEVTRAEAALESATAALNEALSNRNRYETLYLKHVVSPRDWEAVRLRYETAVAQKSEAAAMLKQAQSNLKKIDVSKREVDVARAQYAAAQASMALAETQLGYTRLLSPFDGIVTSRNVELGEVVTTGREVLTVADLSKVELKIYVGERDVGKVKPGQAAEVRIDSAPDRVFAGTVSFISPEAEFTPKIIQTHKERVKLVYLVKISIPNPDLTLKPGMPADAWLKN